MKQMTKKITLAIFTLFILFQTISWGQTNPTAQSIPYNQNFSSFNGSQTTYPAGLQGWSISGSIGGTFPTAAPNGDQVLAGGTNASASAGVYDMNNKIIHNYLSNFYIIINIIYNLLYFV